MIPYNANQVEQCLAQQSTRREPSASISNLVLKLFLSGIALLNFSCEQYRQERIPAMGLESHLKFQRLVEQTLTEKGILDRFKNPLSVADREIADYFNQLSQNSMDPEFASEIQRILY